MPLDDLPTILAEAQRLRRTGQLRQAAAVYRQALELDPNNAQILHTLGLLARQVGRDDAALPLLRRAALAATDDAGCHYDLGELYFSRGEFAHAAECYRRAGDLRPDWAAAHARLGQALARTGHWRESASAYDRAVELSGLTRAAAAPGQNGETATSGNGDHAHDVAAVASLRADEPVAHTALGWGNGAGRHGTVVELQPPPEFLGMLAGQAGLSSMRLEPLDRDVPPLAGWPVLAEAPPAFDEPDPFDLDTGLSTFAVAAGGLTDSRGVEDFTSDVARELPAEQAPWIAEPGENGAGAPATDPAAPLAPAAAEPPANPQELTAIEVAAPEVGGETFAGGPSITLSGVTAIDIPAGPATDALIEAGAVAEPAPQLPPPLDDIDAPLVLEMEAVEADAPTSAPPMLFELPARVVGTDAGADADADAQAAAAVESHAADAPAAPAAVVDEAEPPAETVAAPSAAAPSADLAPPAPMELADEAEASAREDVARGIESAPSTDVEVPEEEPETFDNADLDELVEPEPEAAPDPAAIPAEPEYNPRLLRRRRRRRNIVTESAELHRNGIQLLRQRKLDEAIACFSRLVELQPRSAKAHRDLGAALLRDDRLEEAVEALQKALQLRPRFADAYASLGDAYHLLGRLDQAIVCYRNVLRLRPSASKAHSNLLLTLNYHHRWDPQAVCEEHLLWAARHADPLLATVQPHGNDHTPGRQLRVGYVSPDFRRHSVNYFIEPVLSSHDRRQFHVTCYSDAIRPDDVTERIAGRADNWRDVRGMSDEDVARLVRDDGIDILVDLSGHTGSNRLLVFARKPAPVQVTYLGYPNTTGLQTIDWRISDVRADPPGMTEKLHTERFARMPHSFLCYSPPPEAQPPGPPPVIASGHVTFGCFNILAKVTPEVMALWARILAAVPGSRLLMKDRSGTLGYPTRRRYVEDVFRYHGIEADRLELCGKEPDYGKHLACYGRVDVVLDPFPYNGTTTTCEALWMGVPVVTLAGRTHVARVGTSILSAIDMRSMVAATPDEYVNKAVALGRDRDELAFLRETLRHRMSRSPLTDAKRFTRELEKLYRQMWVRWCHIADREAGPVVTMRE